jgi:hypothetical protein
VFVEAEDIVIASTDEEKAAAQLRQFGKFGGLMAIHISMRHPEESARMTVASSLAGRVYAASFAESQTANFDMLRDAWKTATMLQIFSPGGLYQSPAAAAAGTGEGSDSSAPPAGS